LRSSFCSITFTLLTKYTLRALEPAGLTLWTLPASSPRAESTPCSILPGCIACDTRPPRPVSEEPPDTGAVLPDEPEAEPDEREEPDEPEEEEEPDEEPDEPEEEPEEPEDPRLEEPDEPMLEDPEEPEDPEADPVERKPSLSESSWEELEGVDRKRIKSKDAPRPSAFLLSTLRRSEFDGSHETCTANKASAARNTAARISAAK